MGFDNKNHLYKHDPDFQSTNASFLKKLLDGSYISKGYLYKMRKLCIPKDP